MIASAGWCTNISVPREEGSELFVPFRLGQLTTAEVYVNAERVLPSRDSARNPKSQQNGKDDLVAQRLQ